MKTLVTAGCTRVMIDDVRAITNIFSGRTGTAIAQHFANNGDDVILLTSNPALCETASVKVVPYKTYDELEALMEKFIGRRCDGELDAVIHSAAVSDYKVAGAFVQDVRSLSSDFLVPVSSKGKMSSSMSEVYLKMVPTKKLVDLIRPVWNFHGLLTKFKLQVGISDDELLQIAEASMYASGADFMVANCLEWARERAYILQENVVVPTRVSRTSLPQALYSAMHRMYDLTGVKPCASF